MLAFSTQVRGFKPGRSLRIFKGIIFLAGFYSGDYILEIFSMRYVNMLGFLLLFVFRV